MSESTTCTSLPVSVTDKQASQAAQAVQAAQTSTHFESPASSPESRGDSLSMDVLIKQQKQVIHDLECKLARQTVEIKHLKTTLFETIEMLKSATEECMESDQRYNALHDKFKGHVERHCLK
jgi:hypothetical protein